MADMLAYHPATGAARLLVDFHRGNCDTDLRAFVAQQDWLEVVQLPTHAPDLNPP
jgi:hypothetical protein